MANPDDVKIDLPKNGADDTTTETVEKKEPVVLSKELEAKIIHQIEYYFGDINLPRDKFLLEQVALDDGWVEIKVLLTFNRLNKLCSDEEAIAKALLNSDNDLVIVSDDKTKIRRNPELAIPEFNDERRKELTSRTAYVKGFPREETLETLMKFVEPFGAFDSVYMRTYKDKALKKQVFKGSCFIIFKTVETCKEFIEKDEIKYNDTELIRKWQSEYVDEKKEEREKRDKRRNKSDDKEKPNNKEEGIKKPHNFNKGAILHMAGFKPETVRDSIKQKIVEINDADPAYITFDKGATEGYVRFSEENGAADFAKKLTDSKMTVDEAEITVRVLEGDEEEKFLTDLSVTLSNMKRHNKFAGKGPGRKRKGGRDGGRNAKYARK